MKRTNERTNFITTNKEFKEPYFGTIVTKEQYNKVLCLIGNTALVDTVEGIALLDISTNELIVKPKKYIYTCYEEKGLFVLEKNNRIRIYDAVFGTWVANDWEIIEKPYEDNSFLLLKSRSKRKYRIFDLDEYSEKNNIFNHNFDNAKGIYSGNSFKYFLLEKDGKKGLYDGMSFEPTKYDNVDKNENITLYTKDGKQYFKYNEGKYEESELFDEITLDPDNEVVAYCRKGNEIFIYNTNYLKRELLLKTNNKDTKYYFTMSPSGWRKDGETGVFFFKTVKDGKLGLISCIPQYEHIRVTKVLNEEYDKFFIKGNTLIFKKDDKYGLIIYDANCSKKIEPIYDKIEPINIDERYFAFYKDGVCSIAKISVWEDVIPCVKDCEEVTIIPNRDECNEEDDFNYDNYNALDVAFKKNDKYGFLRISVLTYMPTDYYRYERKDVIIPQNYDSYEYYNNFIEVTKNKKKGIIYNDKEIIEPIYNDIIIGGPTDVKNGNVFFSLEKGHSYKLVKQCNDFKDKKPITVGVSDYKSVNFYKDIIVARSDKKTFIYSYLDNNPSDYENERNLLGVFPPNAYIQRYMAKFGDNKEFNNYYSINGVFYKYEEGGFNKVSDGLFSAQFETDDYIYEARSSIKEELDDFCNKIEAEEELDAKYMLESLAKYGISREGHPSLTLVRIKK